MQVMWCYLGGSLKMFCHIFPFTWHATNKLHLLCQSHIPLVNFHLYLNFHHLHAWCCEAFSFLLWNEECRILGQKCSFFGPKSIFSEMVRILLGPNFSPNSAFFTLHLWYPNLFWLRPTRLNGIISPPYPEVTLDNLDWKLEFPFWLKVLVELSSSLLSRKDSRTAKCKRGRRADLLENLKRNEAAKINFHWFIGKLNNDQWFYCTIWAKEPEILKGHIKKSWSYA